MATTDVSFDEDRGATEGGRQPENYISVHRQQSKLYQATKVAWEWSEAGSHASDHM